MEGFRTKPIHAALLVALVAAVGAGAVDAQGLQSRNRFFADMDGMQEVPAISTKGHGEFSARLVENGTKLKYTLSYNNLEGGEIRFAHVHIGQPGVNGGVMFFLCGGGNKPTCPPGPALVVGEVVASDVTGPDVQGIEPFTANPDVWEEVIRAMREGITYANIHTTRWGGGEIRGQVRN